MLVTHELGQTLRNGDNVIVKRWAHDRCIADGAVESYQETYVDTYVPKHMEQVEGPRGSMCLCVREKKP